MAAIDQVPRAALAAGYFAWHNSGIGLTCRIAVEQKYGHFQPD
jgi:hypothetical protein